ncbi:MAG: beta-ketoacyl synthase N-terminal-like domain-containing protein [Bryobacteraceae bacterium]|nr:beta-ketoacyl synthase N-terminal-like domain-containing protein [Bryobacteraceae bacterium]
MNAATTYGGHSLRGDIAIVGVACTYPGARDAERFWRNIADKVSAITEVDPRRWDPEIFYDPNPDADNRLYSKLGGFVGTSFSFNPAKLGIPPSSIEGAEPDHFFVLRSVYEALDDAGYLTRPFNRERTSFVLGRGAYMGPGASWLTMRTVMSGYAERLIRRLRPDLSGDELARLQKQVETEIPILTAENAGGLIPNIVTGRVANRLNFMGRNYTIDAACASSLLAVEESVQSLLLGRDDMAIAGGVHLSMYVPFLAVFDAMRAISLGGAIRPFDENADGTMSSEGVGILILKRLADAERDGDRIYAVVKGTGSASDGKAKGILSPRVEGEELAVRRGLEMAGVAPETVGLIEGHGTGTAVGDGMEIETLTRVFGSAPGGRKTTALGSVKSNIGHAMPAAGAAGLIKTALALYHRVLPATINVEKPREALSTPASRVYLNSETRPWIHGGETPRRAGVNAFGFGGINAHVVLEEYRGRDEHSQPTLLRDWEQEVFVFEGAAREDLLARLAAIRAYAIAVEGVAPRDLAYTLNTSLGSAGEAQRVAIVASTFEDLAQKIDRVAKRLEDPNCSQIRERQGLYFFPSSEIKGGKTAFLFPGEGSQYLNMLADLAIHFPVVRQSFDLADRAAAREVPPSAILFPPPAFSEDEEAAAEAQLYSIERATETVLTADGAIYRLLEHLKLKPDVLAGHSAGEWIAMAVSGMVGVDRFIGSMNRLAAMYDRVSRDMEVPRKAMLAVGAGADKARELAGQLGIQIRIANDNCPHQVVIVVEPEEAPRLADHMLKGGVFVEKLPYDRGYHTPAFDYLSAPLREFFGSLNLAAPSVPVLSCTTAEYFPAETPAILDVVAETFARPLIFQQTIERMYADGVRVFVEAGPRGNLTAFVDDILRGRPHLAIPVDQYRRPGLLSLQHAVAMLAASHRAMDLAPLYERRGARKLTLDAKADSVLPEEKRPGAMQIPVYHRLLGIPEPSEIPAPNPAPPLVAPSIPPPAPAPSAPEPVGVSVSSAPLFREPVREAVVHEAEFVDPLPVPAYAYSTPSAAPYAVAPSAVAEHFSLMEEFLDTQASVMSALAGAPQPVPGHLADFAYADFDEPDYDWEAELAPPAEALEPEPFTAAPAPGFPMLSTARVLEETPGQSVKLLLTLDLAEHKYLIDHVLYHRKSECGHDLNRLANMPMTGTVELFCEAATRHFGGVVTAVHNARTPRPVYAEENMPPNVVTLELRRLDASRIDCAIRATQANHTAIGPGDLLASGIVELGNALPAAPEPMTLDLPGARPGRTGPELYAHHTMFHGPRFQNIVDVPQMSLEGMIGRLQVLPNTDCFASTSAPAYLIDPHVFDAAGQLVGYWPIDLVGPITLLPIRIGEAHRYAESPAPGTVVEVRIKILELTHWHLLVDYDVVLPGNRLWLRVKGWEDWRFHWTPAMYDFYRFPWEYASGRTLSIPGLANAGAVCQVLDPIAELLKPGVSEMVWMRGTLSPREVAELEALPSEQARTAYLLESGMAKDAVRVWMKSRTGRWYCPPDVEIFPRRGALEVAGPWGADPAIYAAAAAAPGGYTAGVASPVPAAVAVERYLAKAAPSPEIFLPEEREWIERLPDPAEWTVRAIAAKRAVAKWMRPEQTDAAYWPSMAILRIAADRGELTLADPGMAVNAEDTVTVHTHRDGDWIVAVAMK